MTEPAHLGGQHSMAKCANSANIPAPDALTCVPAAVFCMLPAINRWFGASPSCCGRVSPRRAHQSTSSGGPPQRWLLLAQLYTPKKIWPPITRTPMVSFQHYEVFGTKSHRSIAAFIQSSQEVLVDRKLIYPERKIQR